MGGSCLGGDRDLLHVEGTRLGEDRVRFVLDNDVYRISFLDTILYFVLRSPVLSMYPISNSSVCVVRLPG